jgi:mannose-6-phosphate isomerase-like protein (cupin superfamily)
MREGDSQVDRRIFLTLCAAGSALTSAQANAASVADIDDVPRRPIIVKPGEAKIYSLGLGEAHILVDGERSQGNWWLGQFREDPGFMTSLHLHPRTTEFFFVLDGVLAVFLDGGWHDLEAGTTAEIPSGTPHAQGNTSGHPVKFVGWGSPAGFEQSFPEIGQLASRITPSSPQWGQEVAKIISRHDTKVLGPPPRRG